MKQKMIGNILTNQRDISLLKKTPDSKCKNISKIKVPKEAPVSRKMKIMRKFFMLFFVVYIIQVLIHSTTRRSTGRIESSESETVLGRSRRIR